jgi:hypothetical protein
MSGGRNPLAYLASRGGTQALLDYPKLVAPAFNAADRGTKLRFAILALEAMGQQEPDSPLWVFIINELKSRQP